MEEKNRGGRPEGFFIQDECHGIDIKTWKHYTKLIKESKCISSNLKIIYGTG